MKKELNISIKLILLSLILFTACEREKESADVSRITYYPTFELLGENPYIIDVNNPPPTYADPGAVVTEQGSEISYETFGDDAIDVNTAGLYMVTYVATNQDGYEGTAVRDVVVGCPGDNEVVLTVTGDATSDVVSSYEVSMSKSGYATWSISDINNAFSIPIPGSVTILCGEVVAGSADYGMYRDMYIEGDELVIVWEYPPLAAAGTTRIPISLN